MKTIIFVFCDSFKMFRAICHCGKIDITRDSMMFSWVNRKCKLCKSNLLIYEKNVLNYDVNMTPSGVDGKNNVIYEKNKLLLDYNNKKDREVNSINRKRKLQSIMFNSIRKSFSNPIKNDVFMGYFTSENMDIDKI